MSITTEGRDRLSQIRERTRNARAQRTRFREQLEAAQAAGDPDAIGLAQLGLDQVSVELETSEALERQALSLIAGVGNGSQMGGLGFLDDPSTNAELGELAYSKTQFGTRSLGWMSGEEWAAKYVGKYVSDDFRSDRYAVSNPTLPEGALSRLGPYAGIIPELRRPLTLLDVLVHMTMEGNSFIATIESGSLDTAAETQEMAIKPGGDVILTDITVTAKTIAHYVKTARQILSDVPGLATTINSRLIYGVNRRLESQILSGDGTGENLLGILSTTGIGAPASGSGDTCNADLVLRGIETVWAAAATPTACVINPLDWGPMLALKSTGSGERLDSLGAFGPDMDTIWGLPVVKNLGIPKGTALVADFERLGVLYTREGVFARTSDSADDDFTRNRVTTLAEGRFAWATYMPMAAAKVTLTFPA